MTDRKVSISCPEILSIDAEHYDETVRFFLSVQHFLRVRPSIRGSSKYINFDGLRQVDLASLLMLTAELDVLMGPYSKRGTRNLIGHADAHLWDPSIANVFEQFGLYELIGRAPTVRYDIKTDIQAVKFRRNIAVTPKVAQDLIEEIGRLTPSTAPEQRFKMNAALVEAMTNTRMHAYPDGEFANYPGRTLRYWWGGAMFDSSRNVTTFVIYDKGIGLPKTIPKLDWIQGFLAKGGHSDATLIAAAITEPRSQTVLPHRGKGLAQIANAVDLKEGSRLRILSGKGIVTYNGRHDLQTANLPIDIGGSLIEWTIPE